MTRLKHRIGNRIESAIDLSELQQLRICRRIRQRRVRQKEAREADRAVIVVVGQPRRQLLNLRSWLGVRDARDIGAAYPCDRKIMLMDMRERQRELQRQRR